MYSQSSKWRVGLIGSETKSISHNYIAIIGPTCSGKSALALKLAQKCQGEIVSCDSVQVYRGFDIGSAKPTYKEQQEVKHHLIDLVSFNEDFDAAKYASLARKSIATIAQSKKIPFVVGGTGLYLRSLWGIGFHQLPSDELVKKQLRRRKDSSLYQELFLRDPQRAHQLHPNDHIRLRRALEIIYLAGKPTTQVTSLDINDLWNPKLIILLNPDRSYLAEKIKQRAHAMLADGLIDEVKTLLARGCSPQAKPMLSIGYKQVIDYLQGKLEFDNLEEAIATATRQYAKRQMTWFKKLKIDYSVNIKSQDTSDEVISRLIKEIIENRI